MELRAPFPWTGGKRKVAPIAWRGFGADVPNYIEPFFGSGAVLLGRPSGTAKIETVNDIDGGIVNFWRGVTWAPSEVAKWCDWPVSELDMQHLWLVERLVTLREELRADPEFFDPKAAGWWVYGVCIWIGTGWCSPSRQRRGSHQRPHVGGDHPGMGVHAPSLQLPKISVADNTDAIGGVHSRNLSRKRPHLMNQGMGVHSDGAHLPAIGNDRGLNGLAAPPCLEWFAALQERLRRVRVVCGDWRRVLGPSVRGKGKNVGGRRPCAIFLDPPYSHELREPGMYSEDDPDISRLVREWALEHGDDPDCRIALCGYEGEHQMPSTWTEHAWKAARGYAREDNDNREKERIWFSPHCLPLDEQRSLFAENLFPSLSNPEMR